MKLTNMKNRIFSEFFLTVLLVPPVDLKWGSLLDPFALPSLPPAYPKPSMHPCDQALCVVVVRGTKKAQAGLCPSHGPEGRQTNTSHRGAAGEVSWPARQGESLLVHIPQRPPSSSQHCRPAASRPALSPAGPPPLCPSPPMILAALSQELPAAPPAPPPQIQAGPSPLPLENIPKAVCLVST